MLIAHHVEQRKSTHILIGEGVPAPARRSYLILFNISYNIDWVSAAVNIVGLIRFAQQNLGPIILDARRWHNEIPDLDDEINGLDHVLESFKQLTDVISRCYSEILPSKWYVMRSLTQTWRYLSKLRKAAHRI